MDWEALGFKDDPLNTDPIKQKTLSLYVGQQDKVRICQNVLLKSLDDLNLIKRHEKGKSVIVSPIFDSISCL